MCLPVLLGIFGEALIGKQLSLSHLPDIYQDFSCFIMASVLITMWLCQNTSVTTAWPILSPYFHRSLICQSDVVSLLDGKLPCMIGKEEMRGPIPGAQEEPGRGKP